MKATKLYIMVCALCTATIAGNLLSAVVDAAQDPTVTIKQSAQNQTINSQSSDANDEASAITAKTGDIIKYTITIKNDADSADSANNDFLFTKLVDALPNGVELVSKAATREINEDLGTLKPGKTITKEYLVKITSAKDGDVLQNKACFTGRFEAKEQAQSDCESAVVKIALPAKSVEKPATPTPDEKPTTENPKPDAPAPAANTEALPTTGPSDFIAPVAAMGVSTVAYAGRLLFIKRRG